MKALVLVLCLSALVSACGGPHLLKGSGIKTDAPAGWSLHCAEQPRPVECGK